MLPEASLQDQVIIVTGGGTGLGKSMATYFSALGAQLVITSRKQNVIDQTAEEISTQTGGKVLAVAGDVRNIDSVKDVIEKSISEYGKIDGLVNNAAGNFISPTERLSHRAFESIIGIVLNGTVNFTLECGKYWIEKKIQGTILNIVTTYAWTGSAYTVPSAAAKAGVLAMTRSLAVEWGKKYGIRSNAIAPGSFPTKGAWDRLFPKNLKDKFDITATVPLKRVGEHQELANLAAYLISNFSAYVNGEVITIDGGDWLNGGGNFNRFLDHIPNSMWDAIEKTIRQTTKK